MTSQSQQSEIEALQERIAQLEGERQHLLDNIQRLEDQFYTIFEQSGETILIIDPGTLTLIGANENAARRLGYSRNELMQKTIEDIEIFPATETHDAPGWQSVASGTNFYECLYRRKDGSVVPVEVSSRASRFGSQKVLVNFVRDITRRKQFETEREQLIVELDAFAQTAAHDLKSPLATVIGFKSLLDDVLSSEAAASDESRDYLNHIERLSHKMINIVNELLLLANVRRSEDIKTHYLDTSAIIQEVKGRLRFLMQDADATLIVPETWPEAVGYGPWIEEVWTNYVSNAVKYGGTSPQIELGGEQLDNGMVRFWVRDNGPGIPLELQDRLFRPFSRLSELRIQGNGLGLSIVRRIVERLGGEVGVESEVGQGSLFSFTLPSHL